MRPPGSPPRRPWIAVALTLGLAHPAGAQPMPRPRQPPYPLGRVHRVDEGPVRWRRVAGVSPIHALLGSAAGDYEQAVSRTVSLGAGLTYSGPNSIVRGSTSAGYDLDVSAKARYYLYGEAPSGASFGVVAGFLHGRRERTDGADAGLPAYRAVTVPTLGITADVNRFVGPTRRLVFGTGYGLKRRYAGRATGEYRGVAQVQATVRFLVGYAW